MEQALATYTFTKWSNSESIQTTSCYSIHPVVTQGRWGLRIAILTPWSYSGQAQGSLFPSVLDGNVILHCMIQIIKHRSSQATFAFMDPFFL